MKHLTDVAKYWREQYDKFKEQFNEAPKMDSADLEDHGMRPNDPQVLFYQKKCHSGGSCHMFVTSELWVASMVSNDNGACWLECLLFVINLLTSYQY